MSARWTTSETLNSTMPISPASTSSAAPSRACQPVAIVIATTTITAPSTNPARSASRSMFGDR
jgi:hypothetical protein